MEIHSAHGKSIEAQIEVLKQAHKSRERQTEPFADPLREFSRASLLVGTARQWLTLPIEERKRMVKEAMIATPRMEGESEKDYEARKLERWRLLCVIIQEESRAPAGNRCVEAAIGALKHLFPEHDWKKS